MVHVSQLTGVRATVVLRTEPCFDYTLDQVANLDLEVNVGAEVQRLAQILQGYARKFPEIPAVLEDRALNLLDLTALSGLLAQAQRPAPRP